MGPQISEEENWILGKRLVGPENAGGKRRNLWKKFYGWVPNNT